MRFEQKLTDERLLEHIRRFVYRNGHAPTMREMAGELGVCESTVRAHLHRLGRKGIVEFRPYVARGVRILG